MGKNIVLVFDVGKRVLIGAAEADSEGFISLLVPEDHSIVVTCAGSFTWRVVPTVDSPAQEPTDKPTAG